MTATFDDPTPCAWCATPGTARAITTPAEVDNGVVKRQSISVPCCLKCARRMRLSVAGGFLPAEHLKSRAAIAAERRADRRADMWRRQGELFPLGTIPIDAIHGG